MVARRFIAWFAVVTVVGCGSILGLPNEDPALDAIDAGLDHTTMPVVDSSDMDVTSFLTDGGIQDADADAAPVDAAPYCGLVFGTVGTGPRCPSALNPGASCSKNSVCCAGDSEDAQACHLDNDAASPFSCRTNYTRLDCEKASHCPDTQVCCLGMFSDAGPCSLAGSKTACKGSCNGTEVEVCGGPGANCSGTKQCIPYNVTFPQLGTQIEGICQ